MTQSELTATSKQLRAGMLAERFGRSFGTPRLVIAQTVVVALWIAANAVAFGLRPGCAA
jgi:uncharacterized membrane protein